MRLTLRTSYLSIRELPVVDLPNFVVLTGLNGAGKTHLMRAIVSGFINVDIAPDYQRDVRFFDWQTMVPQDTGRFDSAVINNERSDIASSFEGQQKQYAEPVLAAARALGVSGDLLINLRALATMNAAQISVATGKNISENSELYQSLRQAIDRASNKILANFGNEEHKIQIKSIASQLSIPVFALSKDSLLSETVPLWGASSLFQQSFGRLFVAYRDLQLRNDLLRFRISEGESGVEALSKEEFLSKYMNPPWTFVNDSLSAAGLDFEINKPDEFSLAPYEPRLKKKSNGIEIRFEDLSSGEKVLMSFVFGIYYTQDRRQISVYPKLLLLDEIDAPLHPSMSKNIISTITDYLVKEYGIYVILATHSASTVAIAPEDSIFVMRPGTAGLYKTNKAQALNILTDGVPTIAISFDGRRQIFVESNSDARIYDCIHQILKARIASERSLEFIGTGLNKPSVGEVHTGCDVVRELVTRLSGTGNNSVFGLIDWDLKNAKGGRVHVLAEDLRYSIENVLLDPILVGALIAKYARARLPSIGLSRDQSYVDYLNLNSEELQGVADALSGVVLGRPSESNFEAKYIGDFKLLLDRDYVHRNGHELEAAVLTAFPELKSQSKGRAGELCYVIADTVIRDRMELLPIEMLNALKELLAEPSH